MPAAGRHWLCGRRRGCSQHVVVYQRACNAFSTTPAELPTSPRPYAVTAIAAARTQHKRLWLAANLSAAKQDPVGWLRLPTFHFQGPARRSFPKQISQFVASAVRAAIAVDLLRSSTATNQTTLLTCLGSCVSPQRGHMRLIPTLSLVDRPPAREPCQSVPCPRL
jgi:hypothetical protein